MPSTLSFPLQHKLTIRIPHKFSRAWLVKSSYAHSGSFSLLVVLRAPAVLATAIEFCSKCRHGRRSRKKIRIHCRHVCAGAVPSANASHSLTKTAHYKNISNNVHVAVLQRRMQRNIRKWSASHGTFCNTQSTAGNIRGRISCAH